MFLFLIYLPLVLFLFHLPSVLFVCLLHHARFDVVAQINSRSMCVDFSDRCGGRRSSAKELRVTRARIQPSKVWQRRGGLRGGNHYRTKRLGACGGQENQRRPAREGQAEGQVHAFRQRLLEVRRLAGGSERTLDVSQPRCGHRLHG